MKQSDHEHFIGGLTAAKVKLDDVVNDIKDMAVYAYQLRLEGRARRLYGVDAEQHLHERLEALRDALDEKLEINSIIDDIQNDEYDPQNKV